MYDSYIDVLDTSALAPFFLLELDAVRADYWIPAGGMDVVPDLSIIIASKYHNSFIQAIESVSTTAPAWAVKPTCDPTEGSALMRGTDWPANYSRHALSTEGIEVVLPNSALHLSTLNTRNTNTEHLHQILSLLT